MKGNLMKTNTFIALVPLLSAGSAVADLEVFTNAEFEFTLRYYYAFLGPPEGIGLNVTLDAASQSTFTGWPQLENTFGVWSEDPTTSLDWGYVFIYDDTDVQIARGTQSTPLWNGSYDATYAPIQTFNVGDFVGPTSFTGGTGKDIEVFSWGSNDSYTPIDGTAYIGLSLIIDGQTHYGWVLLTDDYPAGANFQPIAWAYETEPGVPAEVIDPFTSDCPADTNNDGVLTPADFSAWVAAFNTNAPECDQNDDDACTPADFSAWVANYNAGC